MRTSAAETLVRTIHRAIVLNIMFEQFATPTAAPGTGSESTESEREVSTPTGYEGTLPGGERIKHGVRDAARYMSDSSIDMFVQPLQSSSRNTGSPVELEKAVFTTHPFNSSPPKFSPQKTSKLQSLTRHQGHMAIRDQGHTSDVQPVQTMSPGRSSHAQTALTQQKTLTLLTAAKDVREQAVLADHESAISLADVVAVSKSVMIVH